MSFTVTTHRSIAAPPEVVWDVLIDMERWHEWCTVLQAEGGHLGPASRPTIRLTPPVGRAYRFSPTVVEFVPATRLTWAGRTVIGGLFDGTHRFELHGTADHTTELVNSETFSGLFSPLARRFLFDVRQVERGFALLDQELAGRAEQLHRT